MERINGLIIDGLKKRIFDSTSKKGGKWLAELPMVIWGLRTQPSKATGQTPFFLVYGSEAILPVDIMWKSPRLEMYDSAEADGSRQLELDSLDEMRCNALLRSTQYLQNMRRYHNRNIQSRSFNIRDMSSAEYKTRQASTNSTQDGKDPSSSPKSQDQDPID